MPLEEYVGDSRNRPQVGLWGWAPDYLASSTFSSALRSCKSFLPRSSSNKKASEFCDSRIDRQMRAALAVHRASREGLSIVKSSRRRCWFRSSTAVASTLYRKGGNYRCHPVCFALFDQMWVRRHSVCVLIIL